MGPCYFSCTTTVLFENVFSYKLLSINYASFIERLAINIMRLREAQGECEVLRGYCKVHRVKAVRHTRSERVWTIVKKTGLFGWRTKKLIILRCPDNMTTYVGTMTSRDGAGVT